MWVRIRDTMSDMAWDFNLDRADIDRLDLDIRTAFAVTDTFWQFIERLPVPNVYDILPELQMHEHNSPDGTEDD